MLQDNLKILRKKAGYQSAKEFANSLDIPYTTYMGYENKGTWPTQENLFKIANKLGVSIDMLLSYEINKPPKIKQNFTRLECNVEFFDDYAKLEYNGRIFYVDADDLITKYEICESEALDKYDDTLISNMTRVLFNYVIDSQPINEFNQNARKRAQEKNIPIDATTKRSPADDNQKQNSDPNQCNSYFEGLRTLSREHYTEKAQPLATTEKLVHDELKKTNRLCRKTKQKSPADDNQQG